MRISDWSSDVCSSDLGAALRPSRADPELAPRGGGEGYEGAAAGPVDPVRGGPVRGGREGTKVMNIIQQLEQEQVDKAVARRAVPDLRPGDTVRVNYKGVAGTRERPQGDAGGGHR